MKVIIFALGLLASTTVLAESPTAAICVKYGPCPLKFQGPAASGYVLSAE